MPEVPQYLRRTFLERGSGFHFSAVPPPDIVEGRFLTSGDPWEVLACVLANLHQGNFEVAAVPIDLMKRNDDLNLWIACTNLIGFAAPVSIVKSLFDHFSESVYDSRKRYMCSAAVDSGGLWSVDHILPIYSSTSNTTERLYLELEMSWLLEKEPGSIWAGPEAIAVRDETLPPYIEPESQADIAKYSKMVRERADLLQQYISSNEKLAIAEGKLVDTEDVAQTLLRRLSRGDPNHRVDRGRMLLEATTGLDCRGFFNEKYILQPLPAAAIVEEFLESGQAKRYEPGVRYFFGHRIRE
jgi:hypothetical protein